MKLKNKNKDLCEIKIKIVDQDREQKNEQIKKIARVFDRFLEKKSRTCRREKFELKESLEDVLGI